MDRLIKYHTPVCSFRFCHHCQHHFPCFCFSSFSSIFLLLHCITLPLHAYTFPFSCIPTYCQLSLLTHSLFLAQVLINNVIFHQIKRESCYVAASCVCTMCVYSIQFISLFSPFWCSQSQYPFLLYAPLPCHLHVTSLYCRCYQMRLCCQL